MLRLFIVSIIGLSAIDAAAANGMIGFVTYDYPAPSPDGARIAFSSDLDGDDEIYIVEIATGLVSKLTDNDIGDGTPVWTPDGKTLVFQSERDGNRDIYSIDLETGDTLNLTNDPAEDSHPKVSADGRFVVFDSNRDSPERSGNDDFDANYEIYRMPISGGKVERLTNYFEWDTYSDLSPDGKHLTWRRILVDGEETNSEIYWKDLTTGEERNLTNNPAFDGYPDWTPDGRILFASNRAGQSREEFDAYLIDPETLRLDRLTFSADNPLYDRVTRPRASWDSSWAIGNRYQGEKNHLYRFELPPRNTPSAIRFTKTQTAAPSVDGGLSRGVAWGDGNGDGYPDLYVGNTIGQADFLYWNRDGAGFEQEHESIVTHAGGWTEGVNFVDVDNDGDLDLFAARTKDRSALYLNDGSGKFDIAPESDITTSDHSDSQYCWADVDGDGLLDAVAATRTGIDPILFLNRGGGMFDAAEPNPFTGAGGDSRACAFGDADGDGDLDLAIGNFVSGEGDDERKEEGSFFINEGGGEFSVGKIHQFTDTGALTYGLSWADPDNDGDFDLLQTRIALSDERPGFFQNRKGRFSENYERLFADVRHGPSKGHVWADFDNDGDLDLFIANGTEGFEPSEDYRLANVLFENDDGIMRAVDGGIITSEQTISAGVAAADYDNDGDLDLMIANWGNSDEDNALYRNDGARGNWLLIKLEGTRSNRMAVGAVVRATADINGNQRVQTKQLTLNTGYASASETRVHFGLADAAVIDQLEVTWPSGDIEVLTDVEVNRIIKITEGNTALN